MAELGLRKHFSHAFYACLSDLEWRCGNFEYYVKFAAFVPSNPVRICRI